MDDPIVNLSMKQKKIAFAQSEHIEAVIQLIQEAGGVPKLVGENEFETIVNAVTLDAQQNVLTKFINMIDAIKKGGLHNLE